MEILPTKIGLGKNNLATLGHKIEDECYLSMSEFSFDRGRPLNFTYGDSYEQVIEKLLEADNKKYKEVEFNLEAKTPLASDSKKYVVMFHLPFYHFLIETLMYIFKVRSVDPDSQFVVIVDKIQRHDTRVNDLKKQIEFLSWVLKENGIKYSIIKTWDRFPNKKTRNIYKVKNAIFLTMFEIATKISFKDITKLIDKHILDKIPAAGAADKKIYMSRRSMSQPAIHYSQIKDVSEINKLQGDLVTIELDPEEFFYRDNTRIYQEELLEEYLSSLGYEIFRAESFKTIQDQIAYMKSVKTVVAVSGSALLNILFMNPKGVVIELRVEELRVNLNNDKQDQLSMNIMTEYVGLSYAKNHLHIGIDSHDKEAATSIQKLKDLFNMLEV